MHRAADANHDDKEQVARKRRSAVADRNKKQLQITVYTIQDVTVYVNLKRLGILGYWMVFVGKVCVGYTGHITGRRRCKKAKSLILQ